MLTGIFSLPSASLFAVMHAVDVAFTEAAVGAGIATLLMLKTLGMTERYQARRARRPMLALVVVAAAGALLIYGTWDIPAFGSADAPAQQHVAPRYINQAMAETGVPNMVTAVLASYRGFDTFGELVVIFTAGIGVWGLLAVTAPAGARRDQVTPMHEHVILRVVAKMVIPLILLFALYVQFHGDYGPGGGFQAGVIFAAAVILYSMLFGLSAAQRVFNRTLVGVVAAAGVLLYAGVGVTAMIRGGDFLDYSALAHDPVHGQHMGILLVELGVGLTVASVMILAFFSFSDREAGGEAGPA
jgi:multicomponent Na+:H+ antiporter subunit B